MIDPELVQFLSTPSARRATCRLRQRQDWETNFYPRPPRGGRPQTARPRCPCERNFYPRPPRGGRRLCRGRGASSCGISIHALREEGDIFCFAGAYSVNSISIHALREEGDKIWGMGNVIIAISIHALREEGDDCQRRWRFQLLQFLSTPSARRATHRTTHFAHRSEFLSTPSARRATSLGIATIYYAEISIHALREEGDGGPDTTALTDEISIHALREEGDRRIALRACAVGHFYPRPPRGGRPGRFVPLRGPRYFYPRPPRGGRRSFARSFSRGRIDFYPRPPRGGRRGLSENPA